MKLKADKGQSALEYMVTYGWMILVVSLIVVVLWQYGVFNPASTPPGCTGFSQISPTDWKVSHDDGNVITITLLNNAGTKITLNSLNVTFSNEMCSYAPNPAVELRAGQSTQLTFPKGICSAAFINNFPGEKEYYKAEMTFDYKNIASDIDHLSAGECHGTTE
jgi:hypothetical protein